MKKTMFCATVLAPSPLPVLGRRGPPPDVPERMHAPLGVGEVVELPTASLNHAGGGGAGRETRS